MSNPVHLLLTNNTERQDALKESELKKLRADPPFTVSHDGSDYTVSYETWGKSPEPLPKKKEEDFQLEY